MKILTINYEYPPVGGGGGVAHKKLVDEWIQAHDVTLVTTRFHQPRMEQQGRLSIYRCFCFRTKRFTGNLLSLLWFPIAAFYPLFYARKNRFDIINAHFAVPSGVAGVVAKWLTGAPLVLSIHGGDIYDPSKSISPHRVGVLRSAVRWVLNHADLVVAQSTNTLENAKTYYQFSGSSEIIPLPYSPHQMKNVDREEPFTFISIGRMVARKAFDDQIRAFANVHAKHPETRLCIIGDGPLKEGLEDLTKTLGIQSAVEFPGPVSDKEKFQRLSKAHCFVLSSLHEGYGIVLQEAMECGLPIVATNHGGQTDFLHQDKNAELVPPQDPEALAAAMERLLLDEPRRERYVQHHDAFLASLHPKKIGDAYLQQFNRLISR